MTDDAVPIPPRQHDHDGEGRSHALDWLDLARVAFVALAAAAVWLRLWEPFRRVRLS